ncbi:MAG: DUF6491 family protein [Rhizomicrobium sp.]
MFKSLVMGGVAAALLFSASAQAQPSAPAQVCLRRADIDTFNAPDDYTVIVSTLDRKKYKLALMGPCLNLKFRMALGIKTVGGSMALSCITPGDSIIDHDRFQHIHMNCPIRSISLYTPAMEAADKAAAAAKKAAEQ